MDILKNMFNFILKSIKFLVLFQMFQGAIMGTEVELKSLIPEGTTDYTKSGMLQSYNRETLFDYMNGGAELYLSYDFQRLLVQKYILEKRMITVEVYEMKTSEDAFGIYSLEQEGKAFKIGDKAFYSSGLLRFWMSNYYVRIMDIMGDDKSKIVITELGKNIAGKIDKKGRLPKLLSKLPQEGLNPNSERFFHKKIVLNNLYFLSTENILDLSEKTSAVMADYSIEKINLKLLLIDYQDSSKAKVAFENFCKEYINTSTSGKRVLHKIEEDKFVGAELRENYLWIVFESKNKKETERILQIVNENLKRN